MSLASQRSFNPDVDGRPPYTGPEGEDRVMRKALPQTVADLGEKNLLRDVLLPLVNPTKNPDLAGDDCGIFDVQDGHFVCASTDRVPWDLTAYRLGMMSEYQLGYYLAVLNLSDIAATGATPAGLLLNLALPATLPVATLTDIVAGVLGASSEFDTPILGGDLSDAPQPSLVATSLGVGKRGQQLRRGGAVPGDLVYITGLCGLGAAALRYFSVASSSGGHLVAKDDENLLRSALIHPQPQLRLGQALARSGVRTTAMDNTDGLSQSLSELAEINTLHYAVQESALPLHPLVRRVADLLQQDPVELAMGPGADFHLVGTISDVGVAARMGLRIFGHVEPGAGVSITAAGGRRQLTPRGWNYFHAEGPT